MALAEDRRTPDSGAERQRSLDEQVEELTHRIAGLVNSAGVEGRQDLREYAIGLLKDETELADSPRPSSSISPTNRTNPLGLALLLGLVALPLLFLFLPVGLTMLAVALVLGVWGVVAVLVHR